MCISPLMKIVPNSPNKCCFYSCVSNVCLCPPVWYHTDDIGLCRDVRKSCYFQGICWQYEKYRMKPLLMKPSCLSFTFIWNIIFNERKLPHPQHLPLLYPILFKVSTVGKTHRVRVRELRLRIETVLSCGHASFILVHKEILCPLPLSLSLLRLQTNLIQDSVINYLLRQWNAKA